ncbi:MAG: Stp1/IreP family PP2C-type Ser/Thr phosphatase [Clostridia bacterium]|nr:Stp1/IreP family PP2C-type Ser/Thr phosphatase [Clostridia bacterium]
MQIAGKTDIGKIREQNEDSFSIDKNMRFAVVADGMGGHNKGEVASVMATELLCKKMSDKAFEMSEENIRKILNEVNRDIHSRSLTDENCSGMGTTLVASVWDENDVYVFHVGDSRCYALYNNVLEQVTKDHTLVQKLLDAGEISADEVESFPNKHIITKAMGTESDIEPDVIKIDKNTCRALLLCSDGLTNHVSDAEIQAYIDCAENAEETVEKLINHANDNGGMDNITAVLVLF